MSRRECVYKRVDEPSVTFAKRSSKIKEDDTPAPQAHTCKKVVVSQRRYERACKRIADANVLFCESGGTVECVTDFLHKQKIGTSVTLFRRGFHVHYRCRIRDFLILSALLPTLCKFQTRVKLMLAGRTFLPAFCYYNIIFVVNQALIRQSVSEKHLQL